MLGFYYKFFVVLIFVLASFSHISATPWDDYYQDSIAEKALSMTPILNEMLSLKYPNDDFQDVAAQFPDSKILIFGYGSLMNIQSASRSIKTENVLKMQPAIAFGFYKIFNYRADVISHWGTPEDSNERAMLNISCSPDYRVITNGVLIEVDIDDLFNLVKREIGYDLIPILVMAWDDAVFQNPDPEIKIAYTFRASNNPRLGKIYTNQNILPVKGYLNAVHEGAAQFGPDFYNYWNKTTRLADDKTVMNTWLQQYR